MKTSTSALNQTQNQRTTCQTTRQHSSGDSARSSCDEINTKTNHIMRTLYLQQTENRLSEQMFGPSLCENTANVATVQTNKNSLRTGAARLLMSFILLLFLQGMAWGQTASVFMQNTSNEPGTTGNVWDLANTQGSSGTITSGSTGGGTNGTHLLNYLLLLLQAVILLMQFQEIVILFL